MKIRLGYVAISKTLSNITTSSTLTYSNYSKLDNKNEVLDKIIKSNLDALNEILIYNKKIIFILSYVIKFNSTGYT